MTLIGQTYFHDLTYVPNLTGTQGGTGVGGMNERIAKLNRYIAQYETDYLSHVLGDDIADEFIAWINAQDATPKWVALSGQLLNTVRLTSPIANYVFCPYWKQACTPASGVGTTTAKSDHVQIESYRDRNIEVWNDMVRQNKVLFTWLLENRATYEHDGLTFSYCNWDALARTDNFLGL